MRVRIFAPATTANLGPGYDVLGAALSQGLVLEASDETTGTGSWAVDGPGLDTHAPPPDLVTKAATLVAGELPPLALSMTTDIPLARGLGSSSAAIVAGLLLGCALAGRTPDPGHLLELGMRLEPHPDNLAPCLSGGLVVCVQGPAGTTTLRFEPSAQVRPIVLVPPVVLETSEARRALPDTIAHADAVFTSSRVAGLVALLAGAAPARPELLLELTDDVLHQPYRAGLMPETAGLIASLRAGGVPAVVSGAGPSVLCLLCGPQAIVPSPPAGWRVLQWSWGDGARILVGGGG